MIHHILISCLICLPAQPVHRPWEFHQTHFNIQEETVNEFIRFLCSVAIIEQFSTTLNNKHILIN